MENHTKIVGNKQGVKRHPEARRVQGRELIVQCIRSLSGGNVPQQFADMIRADLQRERARLSRMRVVPVRCSCRTASNGHAPRSTRHATRSAATASPGESSDGGSSDSPDEPDSLPLIGGGNRNAHHSCNRFNLRKQINLHGNNNLTDKIDRLQLGSAALMLVAVMSLLAGWSR